MFRFGWLTVSAQDLAIWQQFPGAAFTLVRMMAEGDDREYHLGAFELPGRGFELPGGACELPENSLSSAEH